jgi:hypothetical protein
MKKKALITVGALLLGAIGVFAGKTIKGYVGFIYYTIGPGAGNCKLLSAVTASNQLTTIFGVHQMTLTTENGGIRRTWANSSCNIPIYFNPE